MRYFWEMIGDDYWSIIGCEEREGDIQGVCSSPVGLYTHTYLDTLDWLIRSSREEII